MLPLKRRDMEDQRMVETIDLTGNTSWQTEPLDLNLPPPQPIKRPHLTLDKDAAVAHLLTIFPDLCPSDAASRLDNHPLDSIVHYYLIHGITKATSNPSNTSSTSCSSSKRGYLEVKALEKKKNPELESEESEEEVFRIEMPPPQAGTAYFNLCIFQIASDFPLVKMADVRQVLRANKGRLGPAYRAVYENCLSVSSKGKKTISSGDNNIMWPPKIGLQLMKHPRPALKDPPVLSCPIFEKEWKIVQKRFKKIDIPFDKDANSEQKPSAGDVECGCCYSDNNFEDMVQCADGHLFCMGCLRRHVEERTFGNAQSNGSLPCMDTSGCTQSFPWSEVRRALPTDVLSKYEQRQAEDIVSRARIEGLVYCPFCNSPWEIDPGMFVLECPNEACGKSSCIKCKEPSHVPLRCEEVEKSSETLLRKRVEERMTKALIRECSACNAEIIKMDGCNKVTCRCGQTMCYVCRQPIRPNYDHFCQHTRDPGKPCKLCRLCNLWEKEVGDRIVEAAKEIAMKELASTDPGFAGRIIGPPSGI